MGKWAAAEVAQAVVLALERVRRANDREAQFQMLVLVPQLGQAWVARVFPVAFSWVEVPWVVGTAPAYGTPCWDHWLDCQNFAAVTASVDFPSVVFSALGEPLFAELLQRLGLRLETATSW